MWRNVWKDKATAAAAKAEIAWFEGVYTVSVEDGEDYGSGYLSLTVGKNGDAKASGKLADGTSVSATSPLMYDDEAGWFVMLYAAPAAYKGGAFAAAVGFAAQGGAANARQWRLSPVMFAPQWSSRNVQATGEYGEGFAREVDLAGAYYNKLETLRKYYESLRLDLGGVVLWADMKDVRESGAGKAGGRPAAQASQPKVFGRIAAPAAAASDAEAQEDSADGSDARGQSARHSAGAAFKIDVRGMRADQAIASVQACLDKAYLAELGDVEVIHGRGTGALRRAIHEWLGTCSQVASFATAPADRGGDGMTIVTLK